MNSNRFGHGVGVTSEPLRIPKVDTDYLEGK
jgi:hypothetical protein